MSDHDRLADYFARLETPDYRRTLADGCVGCGFSNVYCRAVAWLDDNRQPCCSACSHARR